MTASGVDAPLERPLQPSTFATVDSGAVDWRLSTGDPPELHAARGQVAASLGALLGRLAAALQAERLLVGDTGVAVFAQLEVRITQQQIGLDAAAGAGGLPGPGDRLGVVLLLEGDVGQAQQRRPAPAASPQQALE